MVPFGVKSPCLVVVAEGEEALLFEVEVGWKTIERVEDFLEESFSVYSMTALQLREMVLVGA